MSRFSESLI